MQCAWIIVCFFIVLPHWVATMTERSMTLDSRFREPGSIPIVDLLVGFSRSAHAEKYTHGQWTQPLMWLSVHQSFFRHPQSTRSEWFAIHQYSSLCPTQALSQFFVYPKGNTTIRATILTKDENEKITKLFFVTHNQREVKNSPFLTRRSFTLFAVADS